MEKSIREAFDLKGASPARQPVLSLAYLGDAVYELVIRTVLLEREGGKNGALNQAAIPYVSAVGQAKMARALLPLLSEEEASLYRRGKNTKPEHGAKHASAQDYHVATGLEALLGGLFLEGKEERIMELIREGMAHV